MSSTVSPILSFSLHLALTKIQDPSGIAVVPKARIRKGRVLTAPPFMYFNDLTLWGEPEKVEVCRAPDLDLVHQPKILDVSHFNQSLVLKVVQSEG